MKQFFREKQAEFIAFRHDLHRHPELGFEEQYTAAKVEFQLAKLGISYIAGIGKTGIVATIKGNKPDNGRRIGLRADMDALPLNEKSTHDHCSTHYGRMHACGHDGHTTMLIAAAHYLAIHRDFSGTIYLIFQPAEEGLGGGEAMVKDGLFERFPMDEIYGLHNWPYLAVDKIAVLDGPAMASADKINITVKGLGGHGGATPHLTIDPIRVSAALVNALHTIVSREIAPSDQAVLSICSLLAGDLAAFNVIPDQALLSGTVRTFSPEIQDKIEQAIGRICAGVAATYGAEIKLDYQRIYPATINTPACSQRVRETIADVFPSGTLDETVLASLASEDFSVLLNECPGSYIFLGSGRKANDEPLHSPLFDFNDCIIPMGAELLIAVALRALRN
jgi:amidohydrolase